MQNFKNPDFDFLVFLNVEVSKGMVTFICHKKIDGFPSWTWGKHP